MHPNPRGSAALRLVKQAHFQRNLMVIHHQILANGPPNKHITRNNAAKSSECQLEDDSLVPIRTPPGTHYEAVGDRMEALMVEPRVWELKRPASQPWLCDPVHPGWELELCDVDSRISESFLSPFCHLDRRKKLWRIFFLIRKVESILSKN